MEKKIRKTVNYKEDLLMYVDDDYLIFRKYGQTMGTVGDIMNLAHICIDGIATDINHLKYKKDKIEVIDKMVKRLKEIKLEE